MVQLRNIRINPLSIASSALFIASPFLSWITVSAFGLTGEATLIDVANSNTPLSIPSDLPPISIIAMILLVLGGLVILRKAKVGLPVAAAGPVLFLSSSYRLFGSPVSVVPVVVAPGIGLLAALVSVGVGTASTRWPSLDAVSLISKAGTRQGMTGIGLSIASLSLVLDGLNHAAQEELSALVGSGVIEPIFHLGFLVSIFLLLFLSAVRRQFLAKPFGSGMILAAFAFIIADAAYHISTGEVAGFVGHDVTEVILHVGAYYGAALLLISRLVKQ